MKSIKSKQFANTIRTVKIIFAVTTALAAVFFSVKGLLTVNATDIANEYSLTGTAVFIRTTELGEEDYEDETICPVEYKTADGKYTLTVSHSFEEWERLPSNATVTGYIYTARDGEALCFDKEADISDIKQTLRNNNAVEASPVFGMALAFGLVCVALGVITVWSRHFSAYEQIWFISIMVIAAAVSVLFPEENCNGVNGLIIMALYLADTFLNILCELLISKQSKWNFIVSLFVELTEIAICIVLAYRFATLASTIFFWLPCDIISFINWQKHPDKKDEEITVVRTLKGWQEIAIIAGIVIWTVVAGYFLSNLDITSDIFNGNDTLRIVVCYLDACASAVGACNGVFILLRMREQWIAWYISAALEAAMNIISGQLVLLVLKVGYITNTTYGYLKWTKYIKAAKAETNNE